MAEGRIKRAVELLYTGRSRNAAYFRYALIVFDIFTIVFFITTTPIEPSHGILLADFILGVIIMADLAARFWIAPSKRYMMKQIYTIADIIVISSLFLAPILSQNLAFLRVLRSLRLFHSYHVLRDLRKDTPFFRRNEDVIVSSVNLGVFVFFVAALVYAFQVGTNPEIKSFLDALYFTLSALTTTGFGDITLTGIVGRVLSIVIMVVGVALFLRLAQAIFRPKKIDYPCAGCGLNRHEMDAIHCKHCGEPLKIETEGDG